jgi:xylulokinase
MLAGVATGIFSSYEDSAAKCVRKAIEIQPNPQNRDIYNKGFEYYRQIHDALAPVYQRLASS